MKAGVGLEIGDVLLEITGHAGPCQKISGSFLNGDFSRVSQKLHPGWSDRVAGLATP
jgi:MOSC domain-containing protein YiiM